MSSLLVMVQREVGERLAAGAGDEAYGAVSVKVAYWATASVVGRVSASVFIPRPRVESVLVPPGPPGRPGGPGRERWSRSRPPRSYDRLFSVVRGGFAHRRKMLRRSLNGLVRPEAFEATGIRPTARAEELGLADWERLAAWPPEEHPPRNHPAHRDRSGERARAAPVELTAPAKLTLSLRVTGIRADGYHLLESEMVTLDLADTLVVSDGDGLSIEERFAGPVGGSTVADGRAWRSGAIDAGPDNLVARALRAVGRTARVAAGQEDPSRRRPGGWVGGCRGHPALVREHRSGRGRRPRGGRPVLPGRWPGHGPGDRRGRHAPALRGAGLHLVPAPVRDGHTAPSTARGTASTVMGQGVGSGESEAVSAARAAGRDLVSKGNDLEGPALAVEPRLGRVAGPPGRGHRAPTQAGRERVHLVRGGDARRTGPRGTVRDPAGLGAGPGRRSADHAGRLSGVGTVGAASGRGPSGRAEQRSVAVDRRDQTGRSEEVGLTCPPPAAANGWPSASSCASSCACACGAS